MINLFITPIEIELINELFYLQTKRLGSHGVFRVTLRLRTGKKPTVFESFFWFVYWLASFVSHRESSLLNYLGGVLLKTPLGNWFLKEVMTVPSSGI